MNLFITICARGGSKGIPNKNIKDLNGKPLVAYTISTANRFARIYNADIELSTDDDEILEIAQDYGLYTNYKRPKKLASDTAGKIEVIKHLWLYKEQEATKKYDYILDLDVTSPLRTVEDLEQALLKLEKRKDAVNIFSVSPAGRNPYFNMVQEKENGFVELVKKNRKIKTRQQAPAVYDMNASFYFYRREFFEKEFAVSTTDRSMVYVIPHICFDLDHKLDFQFMEYLLRENLLDFDI